MYSILRRRKTDPDQPFAPLVVVSECFTHDAAADQCEDLRQITSGFWYFVADERYCLMVWPPQAQTARP